MEMLEKDCATLEAQANELKSSLSQLLNQEDQLQIQQASIREHLSLGCKPDGNNVSQAPETQPPPASTVNA